MPKRISRPTRVSRTDSQLETKAQILKAAEAAFAQLGFAGAAVDKITAQAGYSRGAFYSNFKSKEDLFLSLIETKMTALLSELELLLRSPEESLQLQVREYYLNQARDKILTLIMTEFLMVGIRNAKLRSRVAVINKSYLDAMGKIISIVSKKSKLESQKAASILLAAGQGLMLFHFGNEKVFDQKYIEQSMTLLYQKFIED